jgi:hypothetical protein
MPTLLHKRETRRAARRDRPVPPCELYHPYQFDREREREEIRDRRWRRRKEQILVFFRIGGGGGLVAAATALARALLGELEHLDARRGRGRCAGRKVSP